MAYVINNTRNTAITTITDGTVDNTTSLQLFGKSYSGFGEGLNENLVKLLENSANSAAPSAPLEGELWYDTTTAQLKVYDGTSFKPTGGAKVQTSQPSSPSAGDLWQDSTNNQLYFYTGSVWLLAGPVYTSGQTLSGWKIETVNNSSGVSKVISSMYTGNVRVAVLSKETFTPASGSPSGTPLAANGFATINAGLTLNSTLGASFSGNSSQALTLDSSDTTNNGSIQGGANFLRSNTSDTTTGALTIDNDSGITIGDGQELTITASSGNITIAQTSQDKNLSVTINDGGVTKTPIAITGSTGDIGLTGDVTITGNLTITGSYDKSSVDVSTYVDAFIGLNEGNSTNVDGGLIVEQNGGVEAKLFYDTSEGYWSAGLSSGSYEKIIRESDFVTDGDANKNTGFLRTNASGNLKVTSLTLGAVGTITPGDTSNTNVPTIGAVATFGSLWGSSAKTVSTVAPTSGDGADGDFWFVREA